MQKSRLYFALDEDVTPNNDLEWDHPWCNESSEAWNFDPSLFSEGILHSLHEIAWADARKYAPLAFRMIKQFLCQAALILIPVNQQSQKHMLKAVLHNWREQIIEMNSFSLSVTTSY